MRNKFLIFISLLMMVSFSTGIFVEIICVDNASLSPELPSFFASLWGNIKSDLFTTILSVFFALTIFFMPCIAVLMLCKTFSLGFSAAYLLSAQEQGLGILLAVLMPRAMLKLPAYVALILVSWEMVCHLKGMHRGRTPWKNIPSAIIRKYICCLLALMCSSLVEVVLLQVIL